MEWLRTSNDVNHSYVRPLSVSTSSSAQVWLKPTSSSHKLEKLVAQTCPKVLAAMTSGFFPPIHHHSSPFSTHLGSSWIILAPGLCKSQLQIRIFQLLQFLLQGFQRVLGPQCHSRWSFDQFEMSWKVLLKNPKHWPKHWPKHIKHAGICWICWLFGELINHIKQIHAEWCMPACACSRTHVRKELTRAQSEHKLVRWQVASQRVPKICAVSICFCTVSHNSYKVLHLMSMCSRNQSRPVYAELSNFELQQQNPSEALMGIKSNASPIQNHWADKRRC